MCCFLATFMILAILAIINGNMLTAKVSNSANLPNADAEILEDIPDKNLRGNLGNGNGVQNGIPLNANGGLKIRPRVVHGKEVLDAPIEWPTMPYPQSVPTSGPQPGILPEYSRYSYFGIFKMNYFELTEITKPQLVDFIHNFHSILLPFKVFGVISFGKRCWRYLKRHNENLQGTGAELLVFHGYGLPKKFQYDIYIHLHGNTQVSLQLATQEILNKFAIQIFRCTDEQFGFLIGNGKDLTGFNTNLNTPHEMNKRKEYAINSDGTSYAVVQRFLHDLEAWNNLDVKKQEDIIGIKKNKTTPILPIASNSHYGRWYKDENIKYVEQSLPYGREGDDFRGLWFTGYSTGVNGFETLMRRVHGYDDDIKDSFLSYTQAMTGSYFFVPNMEQLQYLK